MSGSGRSSLATSCVRWGCSGPRERLESLRVVEQKEPLPLVELAFARGADFMSCYSEGGERDAGSFLWPLPPEQELEPEVNPGQVVSLVIVLQDRQARFHLHATVRERILARERPGMVFQFLDEEPLRQELLLACAQGESVPYLRRRSERVRYSLPVKYRSPGARVQETTSTEVGSGGIHLNLAEPPALESLLDLEICFPVEEWVKVRGRVASRISGGPQRGSGIEFLFDSRAQREEIEEQVRSLARALGRGR